MSRCVALIRTSTEEQTLGLGAQRSTIATWARAQGHTIESWHEEQVSGSAALEDRHGLASALIALKALGKGSALVVANRSRLAREAPLAAAIEALVERAKCQVLSADGLPPGDDPTSRLMRGLMDLMSQFEVGLIRSRTKAALGVRRARGLRNSGQAPLGYRHEAGRLVVNPTEQAWMAEARELKPGRNAVEVAAILAQRGYVTRVGKPIDRRAVILALGTPEAPQAVRQPA